MANGLVLYDNGDNQFLVKNGANGEVRNITTTVNLNPDTDVYPMSVKRGDRWEKVKVLTAMGYVNLNKVLGVSFIHATSLLDDDGREVCNPYFKRSGADIEYVKVRLIGIGRNHIGNLMAVDYTVTFNLSLYLAQDAMSKWKGSSNGAVKSWGEIYVADNIPDEVKKDPKKYIVQMPGKFVLAMDLSSKDVLGILTEHINRQKFAERNASTICMRNILKRFTGVTVVPDDLQVRVTAWPTMDRNLTELTKAIQNSSEGRLERDGEVIEVAAVSEEVSDQDDIQAALAGDIHEDAPQQESEVEDAEYEPIAKPDVVGIKSIIRKHFRGASSMGKVSEAIEILKKYGMAKSTDIDSVEDHKTLTSLESDFAELLGDN